MPFCFTQQNIFKGWGIRLIPFCLCQSQQSHDTGKEKTGDHSCSGGDQHGYCRPFGTLGLLADGQQGGGAGPVHKGKKHGGAGGDPSPSVV